jgi:hypothetical protein
VLCSLDVPIYVYIGCCTKGHTNFSVSSGIFDRGHFAMGILLLSFSAPLFCGRFSNRWDSLSRLFIELETRVLIFYCSLIT